MNKSDNPKHFKSDFVNFNVENDVLIFLPQFVHGLVKLLNQNRFMMPIKNYRTSPHIAAKMPCRQILNSVSRHS